MLFHTNPLVLPFSNSKHSKAPCHTDKSCLSPAGLGHIQKNLYQEIPGKGLARQRSLTNGTGLAGVLTMPL